MPSSPGWSRSVRELRTHVIRSSSWRRSFTLTDTWPGEDASRLLTLSVCQNGKSKSGSRTAEWSTKRTTSCPTRRTCVARPIPPASRPSSLLKRRSPMLVTRGRYARADGRGTVARQQHEFTSEPTATAAAPLRRKRCSPATAPPPPALRRWWRWRKRWWSRSKQLSTSGKPPTQTRATVRTHVVVNLMMLNFSIKTSSTYSNNKVKLRTMSRLSSWNSVVFILCVFFGCCNNNNSSYWKENSDKLIHWN